MDSSELSCDSGWAGATQESSDVLSSPLKLKACDSGWAGVTQMSSDDVLSSSPEVKAGPEERCSEILSKNQKPQPVG
jgi:hypothetical protein